MRKQSIGIFDSGIGGLTVFKEIRKKLPNENIIYLGDTKNFPYGNKTKEEIIEYAIKNIEILLKYNVKIIVIACGTATSQAIDVLIDKFNIPIIGIIEPTVEYIIRKKIKEVGIIATEGTIRSNAWENKLKEQNSNIIVHNKACPKLADIAEKGNADSFEGRLAIKEYLKEFKEKHIDKIVLGCTHYPIYENIIKEELEYEVELINAGDTVSDYLSSYLKIKKINNITKKEYDKIFLTKPSDVFENIAKNIMKLEIQINKIEY